MLTGVCPTGSKPLALHCSRRKHTAHAGSSTRPAGNAGSSSTPPTCATTHGATSRNPGKCRLLYTPANPARASASAKHTTATRQLLRAPQSSSASAPPPPLLRKSAVRASNSSNDVTACRYGSMKSRKSSCAYSRGSPNTMHWSEVEEVEEVENDALASYTSRTRVDPGSFHR